MLSLLAPPTLALEEETHRAHIFFLVVCATVPIAVAFLSLVAITQPETISRAAPAAALVIFLGFLVLRLNRQKPRLSGIDVAKELRAIRSRIPIALTTGRATQQTLDLATALGLEIWLPKPTTVYKLCHTLDVLLQKRVE